MRQKGLLSWYWSVNSASNKEFGYSQLGASPLYPDFFVETLTRHLQPHLFYPGNNWFGNGIEKAFEPSGLVWSSGFLYPWNDGGYYGHENLMFATFQIVTPRLEGLNDSQKLTVVGFIPSLCKRHFLRKEGYWVPLAQIGFRDYSIRTSSKS